jgi:hypothetical protein
VRTPRPETVSPTPQPDSAHTQTRNGFVNARSTSFSTSRNGFVNASDDVEPTQLLHTGNKTLSAESTARTDAKLTQLGEFDASRLPGCTESPIQQHNELVYIHD